MAPVMLVAVVFGMVAGFVMGWIGGRVYGRHEGRAAVLRERAAATPREPALAPPATTPAPVAGPVVLVVQNQSPVPATSAAPLAADYSHQITELAGHLVAEQARCVRGEPAAITGHRMPAVDMTADSAVTPGVSR